MERLLHSPTLKFHHSNPNPLLPRLVRVHSPRPCCFPESKRVVSFSKNPSSHSSNKNPSLTPLLPNSENGSAPKSNLSRWMVAREAFKEQKAATVGMFMVLASLTMCVINPIFASPAFAAFHAAAKTKAPGPVTVGAKLMRIELLSSAWTGFLAGCLHTLSGPDHLAALAPLSIGCSRMESAAVGALWGCGHDAGQVIFGLLFLLLKDRLHIEIIRTWGSRVVGLTLLVIGAMGIREATEVAAPCIAGQGGDASAYGTNESPKKKKVGFATFATGIVHGLQPDALMMVLPALALPSKLAGAAFLVMFLVGTVAAMGSYTVFIGSCNEALKDRVPRITEKLTWASSLVAIALGFAIIISQFFGYSLY